MSQRTTSLCSEIWAKNLNSLLKICLHLFWNNEVVLAKYGKSKKMFTKPYEFVLLSRKQQNWHLISSCSHIIYHRKKRRYSRILASLMPRNLLFRFLHFELITQREYFALNIFFVAQSWIGSRYIRDGGRENNSQDR